MTMKIKSLLLAMLALGLTSNAFPQGTTAFTYQGRLNDSGGPANGSYDLRFTVYDTVAGGSAVAGPLTSAATGVTNGLFTVALDFGAVFDGRARWLEIGVQTHGGSGFTTLAPRQPLTPVPYAIYAGQAGGVAAANIAGRLAATQLPVSVLTNGASGVNISGSFSGDGAGLANLDLLSANSRGAIAWTTNAWSAARLPVGRNPQAVAAVDVNGDGKLDLISANHDDSTLTVLTNDGNWSFVLSATYPVGSGPVSVATADVNGDGHLDLVCANYWASTLTVLTNDGNGGFGLACTLAVGSHPTAVATADVNADGPLDLICANGDDSTLTILTNDGRGGFVAAATNPLPNAPWSLVVADANGDGKPDLITGGNGLYGGAVTVLTNDGRGGFVTSSTIPVGASAGWELTYVRAADVNGDGKPDVVAADLYSDTLTVLTNDGSGGFVESALLVLGGMWDYHVPDCVAVADMNHDGKMDLVCAKQAGGILIFTGDGHGGFVATGSLPTGSQPWSVAVADLNGDGKLSVICANSGDNTLSVIHPDTPSYQAVFAGNGTGLTGLNASNITSGTLPTAQLPATVALLNGNQTFTGQSTFDNTVTVNGTVAANAFQGDGAGLTHLNLDLLSANTHGLIGWTTNGLNFDADNFIPVSTNVLADHPYAVVAADVNHDGKMDLISICGDWGVDTLVVLTNDGSGDLVVAQTLQVGWMPVALVAADVNGDGWVDLITANYNRGDLTVLTNDGGGGFVLSSSPGVGNVFSSDPHSVIAADVNRDGWVDLICANQGDGTLVVLANDGSGGFGIASTLSVGSAPVSVVAADVNRDGWMDLICANQNDNTLTVLTNDGLGGFVTASTPGVGNMPVCVIAADVNRDGWVDLICANQNDSTLTVLTNDGHGGFAAAAAPGTGNNPDYVTAADVNGDGWVDLICANWDSTLTVLTNDGSGGFAPASTNPVGRAPVAVVATDLDGDHGVDLICANQGDSTLTVLSKSWHTQPTYQAGINASSITTGTLPLAQLPGEVVTKNQTGVTLSGAFSGSFSGDGAGLTNLTMPAGSSVPASGIGPGTANISITGNAATANSAMSAAVAGSAVLAYTAITANTAATATNLVGNIAEAQIPASLARLNGSNAFTGTNNFSNVLLATNPANRIAGVFTGSGAGLTNVGTSSLSPGSITADKLAPEVASQLGFSGNSAGAVMMDTNGFVGIGTSTPLAGLQITTGAPLTTATVLFEVQDGMSGYTNLLGASRSAVSGSLLAVSARDASAVTLVNIAHPSSPVLQSQIRNGTGVFTNLNGASGLAWSGSNLVVGAYYSSAVTILSCTDPANPVKLAELRNGVGGWNYLGGVDCVAVSGNLLAIGASDDSAVTLADISNPAAPVRRGLIQDGFNGFNNLLQVSSVALSGNLLAIGAYWDNAVTLVDVSDPSNPVKLVELRNGVGGWNYLGGVDAVAISGNLLAIAGNRSLAVTLADVSNPSNPVKLAELRDGVGGYSLSGPESVALAGNRLAISSYLPSTVTLVDVGSPANPVLLATVRDRVNGADYLLGGGGVAFAGANLVVAGYNASAFTILGFGIQQAGLASVGWVGIGTTLPVAPLDVVGNVVVENATLFNVNATHVALGSEASASGIYSTALGYYTTASGGASTALGYSTTASGNNSTALGLGTTASGGSSIALGVDTTASGFTSFAGGHQAQALHDGSFVWADSQNGFFASTTNDQFSVRANRGVRFVTGGAGLTVDGPIVATVISSQSPIQMRTNIMMNDKDILLRANNSHGIGWYGAGKTFNGNSVDGPVVYGYGGGALGSKRGSDANVALQWNSDGNVGIGTTDPAHKLVVQADDSNGDAEAHQLVIQGDSNNSRQLELGYKTSGNYATIQAVEQLVGFRPLALQPDGGNVGIGNTAPGHLLQVANAYCDGNTWSPSSDRNVKAGFAPVDAGAVLAKVAALPITRWHYTNDAATPHVGPMAQDFHAAFGLGADDKHITDVDEGGVALAAIQGLNQKLEQTVKEKEAKITELEKRLSALEQIIMNQTK